jgi:hypothetical protein
MQNSLLYKTIWQRTKKKSDNHYTKIQLISFYNTHLDSNPDASNQHLIIIQLKRFMGMSRETNLSWSYLNTTFGLNLI